MREVGVIAHFEFANEDEEIAKNFFHHGLEVIEVSQPDSTVWYSYRIGPTTYGAFARSRMKRTVRLC